MNKKMKNENQKIKGLNFLLFMVVTYLVLSIFYPAKVLVALSYFVHLIYKLSWTVLAIIILMFLTNAFVDEKKIKKWFVEGRKLKAWSISIIAGIISSGPIYMWYPLLSQLKEKGVDDKYIACFLYNRAVKLPLLPILIFYFGWKISIFMTIYMIVFSIINGVTVEFILKLLDRI